VITYVPYGAIIRTRAVWAIIAATIANFSGFHLIILWGPTYISQTLLFTVTQTGLLSAIPTLLQFFVKLIVGFVSDRIKFISDTVKVSLSLNLVKLIVGFVSDRIKFTNDIEGQPKPKPKSLCFLSGIQH
jgi:nitrate/nitrite transporter NarK